MKYRPGEVILQAASPAAGYGTEIKLAGPPKVEVEFDSDGSEVDVRVEWEDGGLDVRIED